MKLSMKYLGVVLLAGAPILSGCEYGVLDGQQISVGQSVEWEGFATAASSEILIQGEVVGDPGTWITFATATSGTTDLNTQVGRTVVDRPLYQWTYQGVIPELFFTGTAAGSTATLRTVEGSSAEYPMWMFNSAGYQCLENDFVAADFGGTVMNTDADDNTCSAIGNNGQVRNSITVHH